MLNTFKRFKAFTLAEVLVTLGIIGIVAALTIPTIFDSYQKTNYITELQKFYTTMTQALSQMATDNNCIGDLACTNVFSTDDRAIGDALVKYYKVTKNCSLDSPGNCFPNKTAQNYDGSGATYNFSNHYNFITADGMTVAVWGYGGQNCSDAWLGYNASYTGNGPLSQICGMVVVDTNGFKSPNAFGKDVFEFYIANGKGPMLYPKGGPDDGWGQINGYWKNLIQCSPGVGRNDGTYCSGRIMDENWQMNY